MHRVYVTSLSLGIPSLIYIISTNAYDIIIYETWLNFSYTNFMLCFNTSDYTVYRKDRLS